MLQTSEEVRNVTQNAIINGVDNPNLMSVDSTESITTDVDEVHSKDEAEVKKEDKKTEPVVQKTEKKEESQENKEEKEEKPTPPEKPPLKGADKRIAELTKKYRSTERERDFEREKRKEAEEKLKELSAKIPATDRPKKEDFDDEEEYLDALIDWKTEVKLKASHEEVTKTQEEEGEKKSIEQTYENLEAVLEQGRSKFTDFNELVLDENLVLSPETMEVALQLDSPEDVLYYLASHADESAELATLTPAKIALKLGAIAAKLELGEKKEEEKEEETPPPVVKPPVVKKQTKTPEPINPVRTTGTSEKDPANMSPKEYRAWREKNKE